MLEGIKRDFKKEAAKLGEYQQLSVDYLADEYCRAIDAEDAVGSSKYISALILRFWYKISEIYNACKNISGFGPEEALDVLFDCINVTCDYRGWQDPAKHLNARQCILQVLSTRGVPAVIYQYNTDKYKIHANILSLDAQINESDSDSTDTFVDTVADPSDIQAEFAGNDLVRQLVQYFINKDRLIEAMFMDCIAHTDCMRQEKKTKKFVNASGEEQKYTETTSELWEYKLIQDVSKLPDAYSNYFSKRYSVKRAISDAAFAKLKASNNQKLYKYLRSSLRTIRGDKDLVKAIF